MNGPRLVVVGPDGFARETVEIGAHVRLNPASCISGGVSLEEGAFIGAAAVILQGLTVGAGSTIGAGAVVTHDVPDRRHRQGSPRAMTQTKIAAGVRPITSIGAGMLLPVDQNTTFASDANPDSRVSTHVQVCTSGSPLANARAFARALAAPISGRVRGSDVSARTHVVGAGDVHDGAIQWRVTA